MVPVCDVLQVGAVKWWSCLGEALQRCVTTALAAEASSGLTEMLAQCRSVAEHFRWSDSAAEQLKNAQQELGHAPGKLKLDCPTRWNSMVRT